jgi:L-fuconolactonase
LFISHFFTSKYVAKMQFEAIIISNANDIQWVRSKRFGFYLKYNLPCIAEKDVMIMRIDAHQHYWSIKRGDYGWITPELPVLYRDFLPEHLEPHLEKHQLEGTILVQAAPTLEETQFILSIAEREPSVLGVVGWLDLFHSNHWQLFESLRSNPKFVGFRVMIQDMPDSSRILEAPFVEALTQYAEADVPVDLLVTFDQLPHVVQLLERVPGLRGVIDHIGKPPISSGELEPWLQAMKRIAQFPGIYCKLSGMVTEAEHHNWQPEQIAPYMNAVMQLFGPERVMYGSDWPVCLLSASYDSVISLAESSLPADWGNEERQKLFGENAAVFYKLAR